MAERTLLIVEDDTVSRGSLVRFFSTKGFRPLEAPSGSQALDLVRSHRPEVAIVDFRLPDIDGLELLRRLRALEPDLAVIILTGHGSIELAVKAMKEGAEQFLTKPVELPALLVIIERLIGNRQNRRIAGAKRVHQSREALFPFAGESPAIRSLSDRAHRVVESTLPVLIHGETGVGKGVLAAWLHENGPRSSEAFVDLNCAGLPAELLETELFGHQKGAFTGAVSAKVGLLEVADRGTAFLDEIGDVPLTVQAKLLKVVEDQRFRRLGEVEDRQVDVRLVAASHRDLPQLVVDGRFRSDLLFRINVISLTVPPLRERGDDVLVLAKSLLSRIAQEVARTELTLSPSAQKALKSHSWPGNVRELRNVIERAVLFARGPSIDAADLELGEERRSAPSDGGGFDLRQAERLHIVHALAHYDGNVAAAAAALGLSRSALYERMRKHEIPSKPKPAAP